MRFARLMANHMVTPLGISCDGIRLSWQIAEAEGTKKTYTRVQISLEPDASACVYDTGLINTVVDPETGRILQGIDDLAWPLPILPAPRTRYYWRVYVESDGADAGWSDWTWFETAKGA